MKNCFALLTLIFSSNVFSLTVNQPSPDFALSDTQGKTHKLSDYKGKYVVLEWVNPECPFVKKHYDSGNMPNLQKQWATKDVVWLAVNSTNPSHSDFKTPQQMNDWLKAKNAAPKASLVDSDGKIGKLYQAKTTPHMYIINPQGMLVYQGAIDDKRSTKVEDIKGAQNFVNVALNEVLSGKLITTSSTAPYGCTVKY